MWTEISVTWDLCFVLDFLIPSASETERIRRKRYSSLCSCDHLINWEAAIASMQKKCSALLWKLFRMVRGCRILTTLAYLRLVDYYLIINRKGLFYLLFLYYWCHYCKHEFLYLKKTVQTLIRHLIRASTGLNGNIRRNSLFVFMYQIITQYVYLPDYCVVHV